MSWWGSTASNRDQPKGRGNLGVLDKGAYNTGCSVRNAEQEAEGMSHVGKAVRTMRLGMKQGFEKCCIHGVSGSKAAGGWQTFKWGAL